jgi:hypothetical protein
MRHSSISRAVTNSVSLFGKENVFFYIHISVTYKQGYNRYEITYRDRR